MSQISLLYNKKREGQIGISLKSATKLKLAHKLTWNQTKPNNGIYKCKKIWKQFHGLRSPFSHCLETTSKHEKVLKVSFFEHQTVTAVQNYTGASKQ